ncbi:MAG: nucleotidyl transferase AbiEii/AbiGii toxin family protein [Candidatus Cybelea sp.]
MLQRAIDEGIITDYYLKGGAALELRFADRARTTKDMDIGVAGNSRRDRFAALERAAALGFDEFTFRVKAPRDLELVDTVRVDVVIAYRGRGFQTIQIDLGPADEPTVDLVAPTIRGVAELGIPVTSPVRCITLDTQAWRVELASLAKEQALPFTTGEEIVVAFESIYQRIVRA